MECIVYCWMAMRQTALPIVKGALNMRMKVNQRVSQNISKLDLETGLLDLFISQYFLFIVIVLKCYLL